MRFVEDNGTAMGFLRNFLLFNCQSSSHHCSTPLGCAIALTRQYIIISSVLKLGASSLILQSAGCRVRLDSALSYYKMFCRHRSRTEQLIIWDEPIIRPKYRDWRWVIRFICLSVITYLLYLKQVSSFFESWYVREPSYKVAVYRTVRQ
jgi:hypothetical protein